MNIHKELGDLGDQEQPSRSTIEYHVHIDAEKLGKAFIRLLEGEGFEEDGFLSHLEVRERVEQTLKRSGYGQLLPVLLSGTPPREHYTLKISRGEEKGLIKRSSRQFKEAVAKVLSFLDANSGEFEGYIETEVSPKWYLPGEKPFQPDVPMPFRVETRLPTVGDETDRKESELHICTFAEQTSPELVQRLYEAGIYLVGMPHPDGRTALIFTIQGTRRQMKELQAPLWKYLVTAGGYSPGAKLTREDVAQWVEVGDPQKPAVVQAVHWNSNPKPFHVQ